MLQQHYQMLIDGEWVDGESGSRIPVCNPATEEPFAEVATGGRETARRALEAADRAFPAWAALAAPERARVLHRAAALVRERKEAIARLLTTEQGKPLRDARKEMDDAITTLDFFAEEGVRLAGEILPNESATARSLVIRQPIGVAAAITPWNYPVSLLAWKVGPALAAGCTMVAKPASVAPLAAIEFVRCLHEAGVPKGVINIVVGPGSTLGQELVENPLSKKIALTGSTETGRTLMAAAARYVKKISLELGGHSPLLVFPDAPFDRAVRDGVTRSFRNMGQICNAVNRIFVHRSLYDRYVETFVERTRRLTIGNGLTHPDVDLGPMVSADGVRHTEAQIADALAKGARLLCGGKRPEGPEFTRGYFYEPSVVVDVTPDMRVMVEETFGPLVAIAPFDTTEEAIRLANAVEYGLVAYLYTENLKTALKVAEALEWGTVAVNNVVGSTVYAPYSGWKQSGFGVELSHHAMNEYTRIKHIRLELGD